MATLPVIKGNESLVKYNDPVLVSNDKKSKDSLKKKSTTHDEIATLMGFDQSQKSSNHNNNTTSNTAIEDVLNSILPPKEWTANDQLWIQYVSILPSTRQDVVKLQQKLDYMLQSNQAKEYGICPIRQEYYYQCFDELIRQITIACNERGLLLLRIRDEMRSTAIAYEKLYESNVAHGIRKALIADHNRATTRKRIEELTNIQNDLKFQIDNLKKMISQVSALAKERQTLDAKHHFEEVSHFNFYLFNIGIF